MTEKKQVGGLGIASIMTLYLVSMAITIVTPAMATFAEQFPGKNISYISTLPTLFIVIGTAIAGAIMGKKVKYKPLAICASLIALVFGILPAFFDNYTMMLVCRAAFGFGCGLLAPLGNALILGNFSGQKQASLLGYGTLFMNAGGIICQMLGGALAGINWQLTFWAHAFLAIALVMSFFLPEPEQAPVQETASGPKEKMSSKVYIIAVLIFVYNLFAYPIMMYVSVLFVNRNAGGATAAATALSMYTVAGVVAGLVFGSIFKVAKRYVMTIGFALCCLGNIIVYFGQTGIVMTIGLMIIGFGFSTFFPAMMAWAGMVTPPTTIAAASSIILACMNLGGFVSSPYISVMTSLFGDNMMISMLTVQIIFTAVIAVLFIFASPFKEKK